MRTRKRKEIGDMSVPRFLRRDAVEMLTALSRSTLYAFVAEGRFPKPVKISTRAVAWDSRDVDQWMAARRAERDDAR